MTIEQDLTQLQLTNAQLHQGINSLTHEVTGKMGEIDDKISAAENDFLNWKSSVDSPVHPDGRQSIFIDAYNGNDLDIGTAAGPFKTFKRAIEAFTHNGLNDVYFLSDLVIDEYSSIWRSPGQVRFFGWNSSESKAAKRKLTVKNADTTHPGGIFTRGGFGFYSSNIDYHLDATTGYGLFNIYSSASAVRIHNGTISASELSKIDLFYLADASFGNFILSDVIIEPSANGHIFNSVGAGEDPNTIQGLTSNITSA